MACKMATANNYTPNCTERSVTCNGIPITTSVNTRMTHSFDKPTTSQQAIINDDATIVVTEVPKTLKVLIRLVARGFYSTEDMLIIDMLVQNPCMKEDDISELLQFERKQLRARISMLRNDKFIQIRLRMETGTDGKAQKVNYYFINYKTFVNVIKYKLDFMRKRMHTEDRDLTNRSSFRCRGCKKGFTDLEADQLYNTLNHEFTCTYCYSKVEEDDSALPKTDTRLMLARFNEQLEPLYKHLRQIENIALIAELLEPEPTDIKVIKGLMKPNNIRNGDFALWSGETTRSHAFFMNTSNITIKIGDEAENTEPVEVKQGPIWMTESTVVSDVYAADSYDIGRSAPSPTNAFTSSCNASNNNLLSNSRRREEEIMSMLLQFEAIPQVESNIQRQRTMSDSSYGDNGLQTICKPNESEEMDNSQSSSDEDVIEEPCMLISGKSCKLHDIGNKHIIKMTPQERAQYAHLWQQVYHETYD